MAPAFARLGFTTRIYDNPLPGQGPVLLATRIEDAKLPTVLGYGHGDVIRGLEDQWTKGKGPWVTARDGDRLYGRGTADNKGQHTLNMAALDAVRAERGGKLGFNAKFIIEMGEEAGSKGLAELVAAHKADFAADVLIASDGPRVKPERPTMTLGCRGAINFDLVCDLREGGHHSGNWGGLIANPGVILAHALASIVGPKGELLVPALKAPPMSKAVKDVPGRRRDRRRRGGPAGRRLVGRAGPDAGRARLCLQRVQHPGLHDRHARPAGQRHSAQGGRQLPAALRRRHRRRRRHAGAAAPSRRARASRRVKVMPPPAVNDGRFAATRTEPDHPWAQFVAGSLQRSANAKPAMRAADGRLDLQRRVHRHPGHAHHLDPALLRLVLPARARRAHPDAASSRSAIALMAGLYWDIGEGKTPGR